MFAQQSGCIVAVSSALPLSLRLSPGPSGTQHASRVNTNKQGLPSFLLVPRPSRRVYVEWTDSISPLHRLHRATLYFPNTEKTCIGNVHFKPSHGPFISVFICNGEASVTLNTSLLYIWRHLLVLNLVTEEDSNIPGFSFTQSLFPQKMQMNFQLCTHT